MGQETPIGICAKATSSRAPQGIEFPYSFKAQPRNVSRQACRSLSAASTWYLTGLGVCPPSLTPAYTVPSSMSGDTTAPGPSRQSLRTAFRLRTDTNGGSPVGNPISCPFKCHQTPLCSIFIRTLEKPIDTLETGICYSACWSPRTPKSSRLQLGYWWSSTRTAPAPRDQVT